MSKRPREDDFISGKEDVNKRKIQEVEGDSESNSSKHATSAPPVRPSLPVMRKMREDYFDKLFSKKGGRRRRGTKKRKQQTRRRRRR